MTYESNDNELNPFGLGETEGAETTEDNLQVDATAAAATPAVEEVFAEESDEDFDDEDFDDEDDDESDDFDDLFDDENEAPALTSGPYVTVISGGSQNRYSIEEGATLGSFIEANNFARGGGVLYFVNSVSASQDRVLASGDTVMVQQNMKGGAL